MFSRSCTALTACVALAACGGQSPESVPTVRATTTPTDNITPPPSDDFRPLQDGAVTVRISAAADKILDYAGVRLTTTGAAAHGERELTFPVTGGRLSLGPAAGQITLDGALRISARGDAVDAEDLQLDPGQEVVTGVVQGRRVPLLRFKLRYPRALPATGTPFTAHGSVSVVGDRALERLGTSFGIEVLRDGLPLGTMRLLAW